MDEMRDQNGSMTGRKWRQDIPGVILHGLAPRYKKKQIKRFVRMHEKGIISKIACRSCIAKFGYAAVTKMGAVRREVENRGERYTMPAGFLASRREGRLGGERQKGGFLRHTDMVRWGNVTVDEGVAGFYRRNGCEIGNGDWACMSF